MKTLLLSIFSLTMFFACENKEAMKEESQHEHAGHQHIYSCPMHPEVTSNEPGKCPKCGMDLEHTDGVQDDRKFKMVFRSEPSEIPSGKPAKLIFRPTLENDDKAAVPLDVVHDKKIHLLIMSRDLSYFAHEHPEYNAQGDYVWEHTFPAGGEYIMFQDYTPAGSSHQLGRQDIKVSGKAKTPIPLGNQRLTWKEGDYTVTLSADKPFTSNTSIELKMNIQKQGKPVTDLSNYLGALAHMVAVSEDTKEYVHVHPMESETKGPDVILHSSFPKAGKYKVFAQFSHNGKIYTSDFILDVAQGDNKASTPNHSGH